MISTIQFIRRVTRSTYSIPLPLPFLESIFPPSLPYLKPSLIIHISVNIFNIYDIVVQWWQWLTHTSTTIALFLWRIYLTACLNQMQSVIDFITNNRPMSGDRSSTSVLKVLQISKILFICYLIGGRRTNTHVNVTTRLQWVENINQFPLAKFVLLLTNPLMQPIWMNYPRYRIRNLKSNKLLDSRTSFQQKTMSKYWHLLHCSRNGNNFLNWWAKPLLVIGPINNGANTNIWWNLAPLPHIKLHYFCKKHI